jgi:hypothetical protein
VSAALRRVLRAARPLRAARTFCAAPAAAQSVPAGWLAVARRR